MSTLLSLLPLGTGSGTTTVLYGEPSSSFAIMQGDKCHFVVDLGYGVVREVLRQIKAIPERVYISHNHSDHSADLPVALMATASQGVAMEVWCAPEVGVRLRRHRLHEFLESGITAEALAKWLDLPEGCAVDIGESLSIETRRSKHSESCYGFLMFRDNVPVLGFSGDGGLDRDYYEWLSQASTLVVDARKTGSPEHASFDEVKCFFEAKSGKSVYITGFGRSDQVPESLEYLKPGERIALD